MRLDFQSINTDSIRKPIVIGLSLVLLSGALYLRFNNLDRSGFWTDELFHVIAAKGYIDNGRPSFPGGAEYRRALSFTFLVSKSFQIFGINEMAARIPSVVFNLIFVFSGFFIVKKWFGIKSALIFTFIMGFSPYILQISRQSRMYTAFQLFYFWGAYLFWKGFERTGNEVSSEALKNNALKHDIDISLLFFSFVIFSISYHFHLLTLNFVLVITFYVMIILFTKTRDILFIDKLKSKYFIVLMIVLFGALSVLIIDPEIYVSIYHRATSLPNWKIGYDIDPKSFYWKILRGESPIFFFLYPISALYVINKDYKKGLFIVLNFTIPFLIHSFVYSWKQDRFMSYFFPFYILSVSVMLEVIIKISWHKIRQIEMNNKTLSLFAPACYIFAMLIFLYPWFFNSRYTGDQVYKPDWKSTLKKISTLVKTDSRVITMIDDQPFIYYYMNRTPDYYIAPIEYNMEDNLEYLYFVSKPVKTVKDLVSIADQNTDVWVIARKDRFYNKYRYYRKDMVEYILNNFKEIQFPESQDILIYRKT